MIVVGVDSMGPPAQSGVGQDAQVEPEDHVHCPRVTLFGDEAASQFGEPGCVGVVREVWLLGDDQVSWSDPSVLGRQTSTVGVDRWPGRSKNHVNSSLERGERLPLLALAMFTPEVRGGTVASGIGQGDHPLLGQQPFGMRDVGRAGGRRVVS